MKALQREGTKQRLHITAKSQIPESERVEAKKQYVEKKRQGKKTITTTCFGVAING